MQKNINSRLDKLYKDDPSCASNYDSKYVKVQKLGIIVFIYMYMRALNFLVIAFDFENEIQFNTQLCIL